MLNFSSKLLENAVNEVAQLPGIGKRTALRLVLHLLNRPASQTHQLTTALNLLISDVKYCKNCYNLSDSELCEICANPKRQASLICVVEDIRDVMAIENTAQFQGLYHVLGGKISPIDGIGPQHLQIDSLVKKIQNEKVDEIIFALSPTIEGDTTNYYIFKQIQHFPIRITTISRGIAIGDELEYADEVTLGRSILQRIPFEISLKK